MKLVQMVSCRFNYAAGTLVLLASMFLATTDSKGEDPKWVSMDYGPYLTASFEVERPQRNFAYKGLRIDLGGSEATVLFDTDLLRYAGGWLDSNLRWSNIVFDGAHGQHPRCEGVQVYANPVQPGWAHEGSFDDPRELPYGPLSHESARWKGLYLHGDQVVLEYSVVGASVRELPSLEEAGGLNAFVRTLEIGPSSTDLIVQVCAEEGLEAKLLAKGSWEPTDENDISQALAVVGDERRPLAVTVTSRSPGLAFVVEGGNIRLRIPAHDGTIMLQVWTAAVSVDDLQKFVAAADSATVQDSLSPLCTGGEPKWQEVQQSPVERGGEEGPYVIDEFVPPRDNPWDAWMRIGGFDFYPDGETAAVCTWNGDVWIVSGITDDAEETHWRRIATGMFQPLGLQIVDDQIYVCCRDQITLLHDLNGDKYIDHYENFNNDHQVTEHFHEFAMDLQIDDEGYFYYAKSARHAKDSVVPHHGTLIRVSPDGATSEILCNGFRAANGVGFGPNGELFSSDQEGHWTPANRINLCREGRFYGNMYSFHEGERPEGYDPPVVWLPKGVDRSPAAQLTVEGDRWGLPAGTVLGLSYGTGHMYTIFYEEVDGVPNGGIAKFPLQFKTGVMRGRFNDRDGQLYTCGLVGWSSNCAVDGGFYRVRYTGEPVCMPIGMKVLSDGITITFSSPLNPEEASDFENYFAEQWNYRWTKNYGSPEFSVENPEREGRDEVEMWDVSLSDDGCTVFLEIEDIQPVMSMMIRNNISSAEGGKVPRDFYLTINQVNASETSSD